MIQHIDSQSFIAALTEKWPGASPAYIREYASDLLKQLDSRLIPNLQEWIANQPISDIWIDQYCINAIMSIRGNSDFLGALEALNTYAHDKQSGIALIWRGKR